MSPKQELDKGADALARMTEIMKDRLLPEDELSFEEELDLMDYEDKKVLH